MSTLLTINDDTPIESCVQVYSVTGLPADKYVVVEYKDKRFGLAAREEKRGWWWGADNTKDRLAWWLGDVNTYYNAQYVPAEERSLEDWLIEMIQAYSAWRCANLKTIVTFRTTFEDVNRTEPESHVDFSDIEFYSNQLHILTDEQDLELANLLAIEVCNLK